MTPSSPAHTSPKPPLRTNVSSENETEPLPGPVPVPGGGPTHSLAHAHFTALPVIFCQRDDLRSFLLVSSALRCRVQFSPFSLQRGCRSQASVRPQIIQGLHNSRAVLPKHEG